MHISNELETESHDYTRLTFINRAESLQIPQIVIWQDLADQKGSAVAWEVVDHCPYDWRRPLNIASTLYFAYVDNFGNHTAPRIALPGYGYTHIRKGHCRAEADGSSDPGTIVFRNSLKRGSVGLKVWRGNPTIPGLGLTTEATIRPEQCVTVKPSLEFRFSLGFGVQVADRIDSVIASNFSSFDISFWPRSYVVLAGGGNGAGSRPYTFYLSCIMPR